MSGLASGVVPDLLGVIRGSSSTGWRHRARFRLLAIRQPLHIDVERLVANQALDIDMLREVAEGNF